MKEYTTIDGQCNATYDIQRSTFIAYAAHVEDELSAKSFLQEIRKKHYDATHNCYAWSIGASGNSQKSSDDGEPSGTAGMPILNAIKTKEVTDIIVVVTRYFGGIKLGAGGLTRAYGHAAAIAIDAAKKIIFRPMVAIKTTLDYSNLSSVESWIRSQNLEKGDTIYGENVIVTIFADPNSSEKICQNIADLTAGRAITDISKPKLMPKRI